MHSSTNPGSAAPRHRRRWVRVTVAALAVAALVLWWTAERPLSGDERALVGTWRFRWNGSPADLPLEYEFRADRTCVVRTLNAATGTVKGVSADQTWRRTGDTLVVRCPEGGYSPWWDLLGEGRAVREVLTLTPDGPDRFRYTGTIEAGWKAGSQPPVSGTLTRVGSP